MPSADSHAGPEAGLYTPQNFFTSGSSQSWGSSRDRATAGLRHSLEKGLLL